VFEVLLLFDVLLIVEFELVVFDEFDDEVLEVFAAGIEFVLEELSVIVELLVPFDGLVFELVLLLVVVSIVASI
jgi:hypothetical protein